MGTPRFAGAHGPGPQDRTRRLAQARYRPVPRWLAGTSVVFALITAWS
ncbi:hypothetical protein [Amycolatopsis pigmentata]|uniref:Uncharacterized protein n=1 Tax=Amycolatopsis pigmentata TaxID=450801 RepID=A0ABW5G3I1_9PSEU